MGKKTNPVTFRLGTKNSPFVSQSQWFVSARDYGKLLMEDRKIRKFLESRLDYAGLVSAKIERLKGRIRIILQVARPGVVIGRGGKNLEELKKELVKLIDVSDSGNDLELDVEEVKNADLSAKLVAERIVGQLNKRMHHRRVIKQAISRTMASGAIGVKIVIGGRVNGAAISRVEKFSEGSVPLSTIRASIDYAEVPALTKAGYIGVKVYINRGEID
ncbi:MAG: 30S ribosomal protein S3 [Patescibacteria group bacterium]